MNLDSLPNLTEYMNLRLADTSIDAEERAHIENFLLDERPPQIGINLYAQRLENTAITNFDDWQFCHRKFFVKEELNLEMDEIKQPWTFRVENTINRLRQIDKRLNLIRVENVNTPCREAGVTSEELRYHIEQLHNGSAENKNTAINFLQMVTKVWNAKRDKRPSFATTELEVEEIINDNSPDWAEQLRNQLGLGHYSPADNRPIEIVLMRYTVEEVLASLEGEGYPAIPTVLDSGMSAYFFPSPIPSENQANNPYYGHTVNLAHVEDDNNYTMGVELLHPRIDYKPEHFFKMGVIARPFEMPLERARAFHLPWLRIHSGRDDFGTQFFGDKS